MLYDFLYIFGFVLIAALTGSHIHYYHVTVNNKLKFSYFRYAATILVMLVIVTFLGKMDNAQKISDTTVYVSIICAVITLLVTIFAASKIRKRSMRSGSIEKED